MKHNTGFTLIEILVVVTIMGLLMAVGLASYNRLNDRVKVEEAARSLEITLRSWQKQVDSGVGTQRCALGDQFLGIEVTSLAGSPTVAAKILCGVVKHDLESFSLPNGALNQDLTVFTLKPLGAGVSVAKNMTIKNALGSVVYQVTITEAGGISVSKL